MCIRDRNEIIALQNRLSAESNQRCIGKTYEVLVEGVAKRSRDQLFGRTEQDVYKRQEEVMTFPFSVINGQVYGDVSMKDSLYWGHGWAGDCLLYTSRWV